MTAAGSRRVAVVETGIANVASMLAALRRAGAQPWLTADAHEVATAEWVVLPGVGAFGAGMRRLREAGLADALVARIHADKPLLAVCLGLQLLCARSEESPEVKGLAVFDEMVGRFASRLEVTVPQIGWNRVIPQADCRWLREGHAYFANSYRLTRAPDGCGVAHSEHGETFVAAIERGGLLACQFHPELSGAWGASLIERWLAEPEVPSC